MRQGPLVEGYSVLPLGGPRLQPCRLQLGYRWVRAGAAATKNAVAVWPMNYMPCLQVHAPEQELRACGVSYSERPCEGARQAGAMVLTYEHSEYANGQEPPTESLG